jgi:hypothetical protein
MKSKTMWWMVSAVAVVVLALSIGALAQGPTPRHFRGLINDYTPGTVASKLVGPYVMHGTWSLDLKDRSNLADFSAAMDMELAEYTVVNGVVTQFDDPASRIPHTHHITMRDAVVSDATSACPNYPPPTNTTNPGFMVSGPAYITGNGGPAPFSKDDTVLSMLQVCVNGGKDVPFSNVTLVFGAPASGHFGMQAIHGVVRRSPFLDFDEHR